MNSKEYIIEYMCDEHASHLDSSKCLNLTSLSEEASEELGEDLEYCFELAIEAQTLLHKNNMINL